MAGALPVMSSYAGLLGPRTDCSANSTFGNGLGRRLNSSTDAALATNFFGTTACTTPRAGCTGVMAGSNILVQPIGELAQASAAGAAVANLRSNVASD